MRGKSPEQSATAFVRMPNGDVIPGAKASSFELGGNQCISLVGDPDAFARHMERVLSDSGVSSDLGVIEKGER